MLALIALLLLGSSGCGGAQVDDAGAQAGGAPERGGSLTIAVATEPAIINPWLAQGAMAITTMLVDGLNDPIVTLDETGAWQPVLAMRVPTIENGDVEVAPGGGPMTIDLDLRPEAAWSDGEPITCADVAFTWTTVMEPDNQLSNRLGWDHITAVQCPAPKHVHIVMDGPYALYLSRILALGPLPKHELAGKDFNTAWNDRITVSSGPFTFHEWTRGVRLVLDRNPRYWNAGPEQRPYLDRVTFRFVKDANTLKMQLRMTEADVIHVPPDTNLVEELDATPDTDYAITPGAAMELLAMQTTRAPLDDPDVRAAVAYAIDRDLISRVILREMAPAMQQAFVPTMPAYEHDGFARYRFDEAKVAELLGRAGYQRSGDGPWEKDGKPLTLKWVATAGSMPYRARIAQLVQEQLGRHGIGIEIELSTSEVLYSAVAPQGRFHLGEWSEPTGTEPAPTLLFGCDQIPARPSYTGKNRYRWCDRETDALMTRADTEVDPQQRAATLAEVDTRVAAGLPLLPLFRLPDVIAWNHRVHGIVPNPAAADTWNLDRWWLTGGGGDG